MIKKLNSLFVLLAGIVLLSSAGPVIKLCGEDPIKIAFYRLFFGFLFFLFFYLKDRNKREKVVSLNRTDLLVLLISGISLGLHFFLWIRAFTYTTVAGGVIPILIQPVLVSFLSILFYKEAMSKIMLIPLAITSIGIVIMGIGDFNTSTHLGVGDLYSSLGIVMICFYLVGVKRLIVKISPILLNIFLYIIAMCVLLIPILINNKGFLIGTTRDFLYILWLGGACSFLGYLAVNVSLIRFKAPEVSFAIVGEPILSIIWAWLFLGEIMSQNQLIGFIFGLIGFIIFILVLRHEYQQNNFKRVVQ
jgi:drug/metabolite transporter (DMT)-like permease